MTKSVIALQESYSEVVTLNVMFSVDLTLLTWIKPAAQLWGRETTWDYKVL